MAFICPRGVLRGKTVASHPRTEVKRQTPPRQQAPAPTPPSASSPPPRSPPPTTRTRSSASSGQTSSSAPGTIDRCKRVSMSVATRESPRTTGAGIRSAPVGRCALHLHDGLAVLAAPVAASSVPTGVLERWRGLNEHTSCGRESPASPCRIPRSSPLRPAARRWVFLGGATVLVSVSAYLMTVLATKCARLLPLRAPCLCPVLPFRGRRAAALITPAPPRSRPQDRPAVPVLPHLRRTFHRDPAVQRSGLQGRRGAEAGHEPRRRGALRRAADGRAADARGGPRPGGRHPVQGAGGAQLQGTLHIPLRLSF